jgi:hypothetical protein
MYYKMHNIKLKFADLPILLLKKFIRPFITYISDAVTLDRWRPVAFLVVTCGL